jgi:hypothetical protein
MRDKVESIRKIEIYSIRNNSNNKNNNNNNSIQFFNNNNNNNNFFSTRQNTKIQRFYNCNKAGFSGKSSTMIILQASMSLLFAECTKVINVIRLAIFNEGKNYITSRLALLNKFY